MTSLIIVCFVSSVRDGRMADRMKKLIQSQFDKVLTPKGHTLLFIGMLLRSYPYKYNIRMVANIQIICYLHKIV